MGGGGAPHPIAPSDARAREAAPRMARAAVATSRDQEGRRTISAGLSHCRVTIVNVPRSFPLPFVRAEPTSSAMENRENDGQVYNEPRLAINRVYTRHG